MGPVSFKTRQQEFWADLDGFQRSGDWEESDQEAESYDAEVEKEIKRKESGAREITEVSAVQDASQSERDSAIAGKAPNPSAEMMEFTSTSTSNVLPSFHRSDIAQTSTPRHKHASDMLDIPIPSFSTPALRRPLKHAASKLSIPPATANTPDNIPSPIDTPDSSRITRSIVEGRGRRDGPATPIPLGTAAFSKLRGKKDFQTLTKHFEAFTKTVAKEAVVSIVKGKGKGRTMEKAMSTSGLGGKVFDGLRFCIPPELGQVTKHKQRWDIVSVKPGCRQ
jgi:DNA polymerase lambda